MPHSVYSKHMMIRQALFVIVIISAILLAGCARKDPYSTVDRGNHALVIDLEQGTTTTRGQSTASPQHSGAQSGPVGPGETTIVLGVDESLYQVADQRGISLRWLIERNDFTRRPGPGDRVIVPAQGQ